MIDVNLLSNKILSNAVYLDMIKEAQEKFPKRLLSPTRGHWNNSFSRLGNSLALWFNTPNNSSHLILRKNYF